MLKRFITSLFVLVLLIGMLAPATIAQEDEEEELRIGFVIHAIGIPFIQQILDGARAAADDLGVELIEAGPEGADPDRQITLVEDVAATGVDGIVTSVYADSMVNPVNNIVESGTPVVLANVGNANVAAPYVGEPSAQSGYILGQTVLAAMMEAEMSGKVIIGNCFPGSPSLENRIRGVTTALEGVEGVELLGPFDVGLDAVENFGRWEQLLAANPDAAAMIGVCAPDLTSLGQLNEENGGIFIAGGYDLTEDNLSALVDGHGHVVIGQSAFVQGYLPVLMLVEHLREGTPLEVGFVDAGIQVVTQDVVDMANGLPEITLDELLELSADPEAMVAFYEPWVESVADGAWVDLLRPMEEESAIDTGEEDGEEDMEDMDAEDTEDTEEETGE